MHQQQINKLQQKPFLFLLNGPFNVSWEVKLFLNEEEKKYELLKWFKLCAIDAHQKLEL